MSSHQLLMQYTELWNAYASKTQILSIEEKFHPHFDGFESKVTLYSQWIDNSSGYNKITNKMQIASGYYTGDKINYEECYKVIVKDIFLAGFEKLIETAKRYEQVKKIPLTPDECKLTNL